MCIMSATGYIRPASLEEAVAARVAHPDWVVLAGGTDLMVSDLMASDQLVGDAATDSDSRHGLRGAAGVIDVFGLDALTGIDEGPGGFRIGAATTFATLTDHRGLAAACPLMVDAAHSVGAVQIAERGTIGGNVMTASPAGDLIPALLALDAVTELGSVAGVRRVAMTELSTGYRTTDCRGDELLVALMVPRPAAGVVQRWRKVGTRRAQAVSVVSMAATARVHRDVVMSCTIALGAVADRAIRLTEVERLVIGRHPDGVLAEDVLRAVRASIEPIDDVRATSEYRRDTAARLVARFVGDLELRT